MCIDLVKLFLRYESVFVMPDLWRAFWAKDYCSNIKTKRPVIDFVRGKKITCCPD